MTKIVELVSLAIADFSQSEFIGRRDILGRFIPEKATANFEKWLDINKLAYANLMAVGCQSSLMLSGSSTEVKQFSTEFNSTVISINLYLRYKIWPSNLVRNCH